MTIVPLDPFSEVVDERRVWKPDWYTFLIQIGKELENLLERLTTVESEFAPIDSPTFTGTPLAPTPAAGDNDTSIATTAFVTDAVATAVELVSEREIFSADKNGVNQAAVTSNVFTKITFGTTRINLGNRYDTATSRWTPTAGPIVLTTQVYCATGLNGTATTIQVAIYKNGTVLRVGIFSIPAVTFGAAQVTTVDEASGTDFYEVYLLAQGPGVPNGNVTQTYFQGNHL